MNWAGSTLAILVAFLPLSGRAAPALPWSNQAGYRSLALHLQAADKPGFTSMDPGTTGVWFTNLLEGDAYLTNAVAHNGAGLAICDVDGDGWADIYLCSLQGPNRLYRNLGNWRFEQMPLAEAACETQLSTAATFADVDGDRDLDLLVNGIAAGTRIFLNDGKGRWTEVRDSGLSRTHSATSMALADIDGDGDLDLYCTHYIDYMHLFDPTTRFAIMRRDGKWMVTKVNDQPTTLPKWKDRFEALPDGKVRELPEVHGLYRNDGHGRFTAIQHEPGVYLSDEGKPIPPYRDWGLAAMFRDLNGDGAPDLYVCNDNVSPDRIWINSGKGTFRPIDPLVFRHTSRSSMGVDFADVNRDGHDDIIIVDMLAREHEKRLTQLVRDIPDRLESERTDARPQYNRNTLFMGRADGTYAETALMAGVAATDWTWCPIFVDVDLDGYEDLLVTNGFEFDVMDQDAQNDLKDPKRRLSQHQLKRSLQFRPRWPTRNVAFRNRRDGTFEPASQDWGFDHLGVSYGMALGDLDNDGDLDVVVNNLNSVATLYRNNSTAGRIAVRLKGTPPNTQGIGARIKLVGGSITQAQEMICGGRYLSGDEPLRVFAASDSGNPLRLDLKWRNGDQTILSNVQPNHIYELDQSNAKAAAQQIAVAATRPYFADASSLITHTHVDSPFDDRARQPLLPHRLSRLGPGLSWYDLNGDGWEDLIVTSGRGGALAVYLSNSGKAFQKLERLPAAAADQGTVLGWPDGKGNRALLVGVSNYETTPGRESEISLYSAQNMAHPVLLPAGHAAIGSMALADIDGDDDLDLFVGGRVCAGRFPESVSSAIWLNEEGELRSSQSLSEPFKSIGMISAATFCDLDADGSLDLALALEWGPVRIFRNNKGRFEDVTTQWGLAEKTGWWTSIAAADFNADGRMDLAVGNWGRNSIYELYQPTHFRIYYDDWNADGNLEIVEAWQRGNQWFPVRDRTWLLPGLPDLPERFLTHKAYAEASLPKILGSRFEKAHFLEARHLDSTIFLNRGSRFESLPLPPEAQLTPIFSLNVADFDGDGIEDLFLGQNFFGTASDLNRDDSGRGLWLKGKGNGTFTPMDGDLTGIKIYGEQRGAAVADFNQDARTDLAVSQNNGTTKLYVNQQAKPGLRVVLSGSIQNPDGVGAQMRVVYAGGRMGPCRTVQAGSGYWSQDAAAQVLGCAERPVALWIRWPGGKEHTAPVDPNSINLRISLEKL